MGRSVRRWLLTSMVVAVVAAGFLWDLRLKAAAGAAGFVPVDARWVACAPRFDRLWDYATCSGAFGSAPEKTLADNPACRFLKEWPRPYSEMELAVRKATGIRPTPSRWRLWMGPSLLAFESGDGVGFCVRPGLLLRAAHLFNRGGQDGVFRYGPYSYAWRDGCCIVSTNPAAVVAALKAPAYAPDVVPEPQEIRFDWHDSPETVVFVRPADGWAVRGHVRMSVAASAGQNALAGTWPGGALIEMAGSDCRTVAVVTGWLRQAVGVLPDWTALEGIVPPWAVELAGNRPCAAALLAQGDPQTQGFAWALRMAVAGAEEPHPLQLSVAAPVSPALGRVRDTWLAASDPQTLAALETEPLAETGASADAVLHVDWAKTGKALEQYLRGRSDKDEALVPPVEMYGAPAARALAQLGELRIQGQAEGDTLTFEGSLTAPKP